MRSIGNVTVTCKSLLMPNSTSVPARSLSAPGLLNSGRMERPWARTGVSKGYCVGTEAKNILEQE